MDDTIDTNETAAATDEVRTPAALMARANELEWSDLPRKELDEKADALMKEAEAARMPVVPFPAWTGKADPKKAAAVVKKFIYNGKILRPAIQSVYHDKGEGLVVATNGRILVATKHGFDPSAPDRTDFPDWRGVLPPTGELDGEGEINPVEVANICRWAAKTARTLKYSKPPTVLFRFGREHIMFYAHDILAVADAMAANGIATIRFQRGVYGPTVAKNGDTEIAVMPVRMSGGKGCGAFDPDCLYGRRDDPELVVDGGSGRVVVAPFRYGGCKATERYLEVCRKCLEEAERRTDVDAAEAVAGERREIARTLRIMEAEAGVESLLMKREDASVFLGIAERAA